jgi:hypothetical protein
VTVAANYRLLENGEVGFKLGKYDRRQQLVIDPIPQFGPSVYYSTYLGSGSGDMFSSIAVDAAGEAFICGSTYANNYPTGALPGYSPYQGTVSGAYQDDDVPAGFVTALNATGTGIIYSTYIGGNSFSSNIGVSLNGLAVDASGFAFVGGQTDDITFPMMKAFQGTMHASVTAYTPASGIVFELSQHGDSLIYSSYLGGGNYDSISAIAVDGSDNAYVTGSSTVQGNSLTASNFPVTSGVIWGDFTQMNIGAGFNDAFASKIAPPTSGNAALAYSTVIGSATTGGTSTTGNAIAVDSNGNAYVTGTTYGDIGDHGGTITTKHSMTHASATQGEYAPTVWVLELNSGATAAVYLDYLGGSTPSSTFSPQNTVAGIKVDANFLAYVAGTTEANNFQTTSGAYQSAAILAGSTYGGNEQADGFVTVIAAGGASFTYSTYLNGNTISSQQGYGGSPAIAGIALGTNGQFAVAGLANTTNFPLSVPDSPGGTPLLSAYPGSGCPGSAACPAAVPFITKFNSAGSLIYSTYLGAGNENAVNGIASNGTDIYVMIAEGTNGLNTGGAYDSDNSSGEKELIVRVSDALPISTSIAVGAQTAPTDTSAQTVSLTSTLSASSTVNGGVVTYTVTNSGSTQIGSQVTSGIVAGNVTPTTSYTLPGNTPAATYTITASYRAAEDFLDTSGTANLVTGGVPTVGVTIASSPTGLTFSSSGTGCAPGSYTAPMTLQWTPASSCTVAYTTPQAGSAGIQYVFSQWENSSTSASRAITAPASTTTYTATFLTQYQLTTAAAAGGSVTPTSGLFYNLGTVVNLQATPNGGFAFSGWTGSTVASASSASTTITLTGPASVTANFTVGATIASSPTGLSFSVTGTGCAPGSYTSPMTLQWVPSSFCTVTYATPQAGTAGIRYAFGQWENAFTNPARGITAPSAATTYTGTFNTQYQLTTATVPGAGGSITPASLQFYNSGTVVNLQATANTGFAFSSWTGAVANGSTAATTITLNGPATVTANFNVNVTIASVPSGLSFGVTGTGCAAGAGLSTPQTLVWTPGSSCTVTFATPQAGTAGTQYAFTQWENTTTNAARVITAPTAAATYTATFTTQYQLTTAVLPSPGGSITPASGQFYNSGTVVSLQATANPGFAFNTWTGTVANTASAATTITLAGPASVTANFNPAITIGSAPAGLSFTVTGTGCAAGAYATPQVLAWVAASSCTVTFATPQAGAAGTQYAFSQWENNSTSASRPITAPASATTYTASFLTQYLLTTAVSPSLTDGSIAPASGYVNSGLVVGVSATANTGFVFNSFSGGLNGSTNPQNITVSAPVTVTAGFSAKPASVTASAGTPQSATISTAFGAALQALVKDASSNPLSGVTVTFTAPGSGAGGSFPGSQSMATAVTNGSGIATAPVFTANTSAGAYAISASVLGVVTGASFGLTNLAGPAASVAPSVGSPQSATISTAFGTALQALVKDASNNPVSGVTVAFTAPGSGASGSFPGRQSVATAVTNASGIATAPVFTANTIAGAYAISASAAGVPTVTSFALTNLAGPVASVAPAVGSPQSVTINTALGTALQALVKDASNNPVSGVTVTFTAPGSGAGGSFPGGQSVATAITNASGIATAPVFTANTIAGVYAISASVPGLPTGTRFLLTNLAAPAASVAPSVGSPQSATINTAFGTALQALVKDASNNPVSGVTVTFTAPGSGAGGSFPGGQSAATAITNASGIATAPVFAANTIAGAYLISAAVAGVPIGTNFALTNLAGPAASVTAAAGTPQTALVSTAFTTVLQAAVADGSGNPVNGAAVTFAILSGAGASGTFPGNLAIATVNTNASGIAVAPMVTANANAGFYTVTAVVPGVALAASFALSNSALAPPGVTPQSLSFMGNFGDSTPIPAQNVTITTASPAAFTLTSSATWLTAAGAAGSISVAASTTGLAAGAYSGSIAIAFSNGQTASIQVSLTVVGLPLLVTDQASLTFAYNGASPPPAQQFLLGAQNRNTNFAISVSASWITATSTRSQTPATIVVTVNPAGIPAGSYPGSVVVTSPGSPNSPLTIPVTLVIVSTTSTGPTAPITPTINSGGLLNASNFLAESGAPDTIMTAFGNIPCSAPVVLLNGQATEVIGSTATLVSFTLPASLAGESSVNIQIGCNNVISVATTLPLAQTAPGIFTLSQNGSGPGAVLNLNESVNSAANPASRGSYVAIFVTGFGLFDPPSSDGLSRLSLPVTAFFGTVQGTVVYAGEAPGLTYGLQQINVMIPANAPTGPAVPLSLSVGGNTTQSGVTVAIQ